MAGNLGDARRDRQAQHVRLALARRPELSLPKVFADEAQLQAMYDLLEHSRDPARVRSLDWPIDLPDDDAAA